MLTFAVSAVLNDAGLASLGCFVADVASPCRSPRPVHVLVLTPGSGAARAFQESRHCVAMPFLQWTGSGGLAGDAALIGERSDFPDKAGVLWPTRRDLLVAIPGVLAVEPHHECLKPLPHLPPQLRLIDGGDIPGPRHISFV